MRKKKVKRHVRNGILIGVTLMASYLVFTSVGIIELPEWDSTWYPVQICMFVVGMAWLILFGVANGAFDSNEENEEDGETWDI